MMTMIIEVPGRHIHNLCLQHRWRSVGTPLVISPMVLPRPLPVSQFQGRHSMTTMSHSIPTRAMWSKVYQRVEDIFKPVVLALLQELSGKDLLVVQDCMTLVIPPESGKAPTAIPLRTALEATSRYWLRIRKDLLRSEVPAHRPHRPQGTLHDVRTLTVPLPALRIIHQMEVPMIGWILKFGGGPGRIALAQTTSRMKKTIVDRCSPSATCLMVAVYILRCDEHYIRVWVLLPSPKRNLTAVSLMSCPK